MPEEASALRTQPVTFVPTPSRHTVHPAELGEVVGAILTYCVGPINRFQTCYAVMNVPSSLPAGTTIQNYVTRPGGAREPIPGLSLTITPEYAGNAWIATLWYKPFPADYLAGIVKFETVIVADGLETTIYAEVPWMMFPVPLVGPLKEANHVSGSSIFLEGDFSASLIAMAPLGITGNQVLPLEGRFIPSSAGLKGQVVLVVSSEVSPRQWESSTRMLYLSEQETAPRNR